MSTLWFPHLQLPHTLLSSAFASLAAAQTADIVLYNGKVAIMDDAFTIHKAIAVSNGRVLAVGADDLRTRYPNARAVDLKGRLVLPGFNDTHIHLSGDPVRHIDLTKLNSVKEIQNQVKAKASRLGPGEWITGYGWSEDQLAEKRKPTRPDLDAAAPNNPVVLTRAGGHSVTSNSMALARADINKATPDPERGSIEHGPDGEPTGVVRERADLFYRYVPKAKPEEVRASLVSKVKDLLALGITSFIVASTPVDGDSERPTYAEWQSVYRQYGAALPRAAIQILWPGEAKMRAFGHRRGDGDDRLRVGAIKLFIDGGFTGPAAYTLKPYKGQGEYRGKLTRPESELAQIMETGHKMGWQFGMHTIGDGGIQLAVDILEKVLKASPRTNHRHYLNHFSMLPPEAVLKKMAANHIAIAQQPNFTYTLEGRYADNLEGWRLEHNNPITTPRKHGIFMAFGSDILPIGPLVGLYAAVTRKGMSGAVYGAEEKVSMREALRMYTRDGAWFTFEEKEKGTLEPGKLADLIVMADDLLTIPPERILSAKVDLTMVAGKILYQAKP